jgi:hypothetical protein
MFHPHNITPTKTTKRVGTTARTAAGLTPTNQHEERILVTYKLNGKSYKVKSHTFTGPKHHHFI